jgi:flagellar biosynthesis protein FlhB
MFWQIHAVGQGGVFVCVFKFLVVLIYVYLVLTQHCQVIAVLCGASLQYVIDTAFHVLVHMIFISSYAYQTLSIGDLFALSFWLQISRSTWVCLSNSSP